MHNELHCYISQIGLVLKITKDESVLIAAHQIKTISPYYSEKKRKSNDFYEFRTCGCPFLKISCSSETLQLHSTCLVVDILHMYLH